MNFEQLVTLCRETHEAIRARAVRAVDLSLVIRNWLFGRYIVEFEHWPTVGRSLRMAATWAGSWAGQSTLTEMAATGVVSSTPDVDSGLLGIRRQSSALHPCGESVGISA